MLAGRQGEPRPAFAQAWSRSKRAMLPGRGGRVDLGPRVRPGTVSLPKRAMLPGRGGRVDLSRRSPGASMLLNTSHIEIFSILCIQFVLCMGYFPNRAFVYA